MNRVTELLNNRILVAVVVGVVLYGIIRRFL